MSTLSTVDSPPAGRLRRFADGLLVLARSREYGLLLLIALTVVTVSIKSPDFLDLGNLRDILEQAAPVVVIACGVMLVVLTGEIDISVGSLMGLLAALLALLASADRCAWHPAVAILFVLLAGAAVGACTGLMVTIGRVPSIIVTLGMLTALRGVTILTMGGENIKNFPAMVRFLGTGEVLGLPVDIGVAAAVVILTGFILVLTPLGRRIFALGSNPHASELIGLSERTIKLFVFAYTGFLTGVATLLAVGKLGNVAPSMGKGRELLVVTCVVVGGVSISGGRGKLRGVVLAVLLMVMMRTVLTFMEMGPEATKWERAIQGAFILLAVVVDHLASRHHGSGR